MKVELIYEKSCPNIIAAREQLLKAFHLAKKQPHWSEWEISSEDTPDYARKYGSPTILINGIDVSAMESGQNSKQCRVYCNEQNQLVGIPNLDDILTAMMRTTTTQTKWQLISSLLPVIGVAVMPKLVCPACWPAYTGLLSALGISFLDYTPYLLPMTLLFVLVALGALLFRAGTRHGYGPFILGLLSSIVLMMGKFYFNSELSMYIGLSFLILASIWNTWPQKTLKGTVNCPACIPSNNLIN